LVSDAFAATIGDAKYPDLAANQKSAWLNRHSFQFCDRADKAIFA
jgi:hypothetical protein